jgi:CAAX protease family protein
MATSTRSETKSRLFPLLIYLVLFFGTWVAWVLWIYPALTRLGERTLIYALVNNGLRLLIWVIPVFLYLRFVDRVEPFNYLKLNQNWRRGIVAGLSFTVLNFLMSAVAYGVPAFNWEVVTWNSVIGTSFLIGFVEEIPFRGFILQKLQERMSFWPANVVSSLLFLLIHFPGWISLRLLNPGTVVAVFVIGFLLAILFRYSRSLWSAIVAHSGNDFISFLIFHR